MDKNMFIIEDSRADMKIKKEYIDIDILTGTYTRKYVEQYMKKCPTRCFDSCAILFVDINGLKKINDVYGHGIGDLVLVTTGNIIKKVIYSKAVIGRWGSDEFLVFFPEVEEKQVKRYIEEIYSESKKSLKKEIACSLAMGFTMINQKDSSYQEMLARAENRLCSNKVLDKASSRSKVNEIILNMFNHKNTREKIHSTRVSKLCKLIGTQMGFSNIELGKIVLAGNMHDIGKIAIDGRVLDKEGILSVDEWSEIKKHPEIGYRIVCNSIGNSDIANAVLAHHERWDGKGYPYGLKGEEIPLMARIISVADTYDAMTAYRTYKKSILHREAVEELIKVGGVQLDKLVVDAFLRVPESFIISTTIWSD